MVVDCRVSHFGRSLLRMIYWYLFSSFCRAQGHNTNISASTSSIILISHLQCLSDLENTVVCFSLFYNMFAIFLSSLVHFMLEEVVNSTVNRCLSPELMEPSVSRQYSLVLILFHCATRNNFLIDGSAELFERRECSEGQTGFLSWTGLY